MKRRLILVAIGFVLGLALVIGCQVGASPPAQNDTTAYTEHWLMTAGNDAFILCDSGQFVVTVNGADSLYVQCVAPAGAEK